jgi:hypothetical protein
MLLSSAGGLHCLGSDILSLRVYPGPWFAKYTDMWRAVVAGRGNIDAVQGRVAPKVRKGRPRWSQCCQPERPRVD